MVTSFHHSLVYSFTYVYHIWYIPCMVDTENQKINETDLILIVTYTIIYSQGNQEKGADVRSLYKGSAISIHVNEIVM